MVCLSETQDSHNFDFTLDRSRHHSIRCRISILHDELMDMLHSCWGVESTKLPMNRFHRMLTFSEVSNSGKSTEIGSTVTQPAYTSLKLIFHFVSYQL